MVVGKTPREVGTKKANIITDQIAEGCSHIK